MSTYDFGKPTGRRVTVALTIEVLVEVPEYDNDTYNTAVAFAIEDVRKRIVEAKTFLPMSMQSTRMYADVTVQELRDALVMPPTKEWGKR